MIEATLCFVVRDGQVLLIEKRRGLGEGWYNGPGGKLEAGETPRECAVREVREEVGIDVEPEALTKAGELTFCQNGEKHTHCHVFRTDRFSGTPTSSAEAHPEWVDIPDVPYDQMWEDDRLWLPGVLKGKTVHGRFRFEGEGDLDEATFVDYDLEWGVSFESP